MKSGIVILALAGALLAAACGPSRPAAAGAPASVAPPAASPVAEGADAYEMPNSAVHEIRSAKLGRAYDIYVRLPPGYADAPNAAKRYPVVYINDAHYTFQTAAGVTLAPMRHGGLEPAILVAMSYAKGENGADSRNRDLTPVELPDRVGKTGGARAYLTFIKDEVIPYIETAYRADPARRTLTGQSYGGLFGAYALFEEPGLFADYILTSPSLWFAGGSIFETEDKFAQTHTKLPARVFLAIGQTETPAINHGRYDMVADQKRFAAKLRSRKYEGLVVRDEVVSGGTHLTTFPIGLLHGLMWTLPGPDPYGG